jgi:hypothetical protein
VRRAVRSRSVQHQTGVGVSLVNEIGEGAARKIFEKSIIALAKASGARNFLIRVLKRACWTKSRLGQESAQQQENSQQPGRGYVHPCVIRKD